MGDLCKWPPRSCFIDGNPEASSGPTPVDPLIAHDQADPGARDLRIGQIDILPNQPRALAMCINQPSAHSRVQSKRRWSVTCGSASSWPCCNCVAGVFRGSWGPLHCTGWTNFLRSRRIDRVRPGPPTHFAFSSSEVPASLAAVANSSTSWSLGLGTSMTPNGFRVWAAPVHRAAPGFCVFRLHGDLQLVPFNPDLRSRVVVRHPFLAPQFPQNSRPDHDR